MTGTQQNLATRNSSYADMFGRYDVFSYEVREVCPKCVDDRGPWMNISYADMFGRRNIVSLPYPHARMGFRPLRSDQVWVS